MSYTQLDNINETVIKKIVANMQEVIGDGIKEDMHHLKTSNSKASRVWDLLNTALLNNFNTPYCMSYDFKRGPWQMVMLYEKETGFLFTIMREKRFKEISSKIISRKNMHYIDMFVRHLNFDLQSNIEQISLFPHSFNDETCLEERVNSLLRNLKEDGAIITRHVLVLFDIKFDELNSIRAVMVDRNLNIVVEQDWTKYIEVQESTVINKIFAENIISDKPTRGLELKAKALARKDSSPLRQLESEQKNNP